MQSIQRSTKRWQVRLGVVLFGAVGLSCTVVAYRSVLPKLSVAYETVEIDGAKRSYRLAVNAQHREGDQVAIPLIVALHGALDTVDQMAAGTGLDQLAIKHDVAICYLQGRNLNWPPFIPPDNPTLADPDYAFFDAAIENVTRTHNIDRTRIYVVGVSQGGAMTNLIVSRRSEVIAAAVDCCGWLPDGIGEIMTSNKCPMLFVVGSDDSQVTPESVRDARRAFQEAGHPTEYREIDGFGHGWANELGMNRITWDFLNRQRLAVDAPR